MPLRIAFAIALLLLAGCSKEARTARHLERANRFLQAAQIDKAEIEYANVLRLDPQNSQAARQLGFIYFDQGKPGNAFPLLEQAKARDPDDAETRLKLASLYLAGRKFKEARAEAESILERQPGHDEALLFLADAVREPADIQLVRDRLEKMRPQLQKRPGFHAALGTLLFRQKKIAEAETAFKEAVRLGPELAMTHSALAHFYATQGNATAAEPAYKAAFDLSPPRSSRRLDYIDFKVRQGDAALGKKLLEQLVQQAPDCLPALNRLAELNFGEKKFDEATALLRKVLTRDPRNFEAMHLEGLLHLTAGNTPKAVAQFGRMNSLFPSVAKVQYHLALALLGTNDTAAATTLLNQAIRQDPAYTEAILLLAEINTRKGDLATAIALLLDLTQKRPRLIEAQLLLAGAYRLRNDLDEALAVYQRVAQINPQNPQAPLLIGGVLLQQNKTNQARGAFEDALKVAPDFMPALEQLIALDLAQKRFGPAFERLEKELARKPNAPGLHVLLARTFYEQGQKDKVETELLRAIELDPLRREPYMLLAQLYFEGNEHTQAIERLKGLIARDPKDVPALMLLGVIYHQAKNYPAEREMYERALAANPRFSPALNNLAYLYSEHLSDLNRAFDMAQRARALLPWDPYAADTLGWILYKRGDYSWALSLLQESADRLSNQPEVLYHHGMAQYMMGYETAARVSLDRAVQSGKDFPGRDLCMRRLAILALDVAKADPDTLKQLDQNDPIALAKLAAAHEHAGAFDNARHAYERALALSPKNVSVMTRLAKLYYRDPATRAKALDLAHKARALAPDDPAIAHALGRIAMDAGQAADLQWAHSLLQESARKLPNDPEVAYDLAWSWYSFGEFTQAENALRKALESKQFSRTEEAQRFLQFLTGQAGDSDIRTALEQRPGYVPALVATAATQERQNQPNLARKTYESVLNRFPMFVPAHKRLAIILDKSGELEKARQHARQAREHAPNDAEAAKILGIIAFKHGDFARSAQLLRESSRQQQSDPEIFYYLGMAHYSLKQLQESKDALRQALALNVPPSMAEKASRLLAEMN